MHLRPFQGLETFGMDFDIVMIVNCGSNSNELLVMQVTQPKNVEGARERRNSVIIELSKAS